MMQEMEKILKQGDKDKPVEGIYLHVHVNN